MSTAALLAEKPHLTDADIDEAMAGNPCRCATYFRIRNAIHHALGCNPLNQGAVDGVRLFNG